MIKRRSFLAMLGIAPAVAAVPAVAATKEIFPLVMGEKPGESVITVDMSNIGTIQAGDIQRMIAEQQEWVRRGVRDVLDNPRLR